jgi:hypothetical protein
MAMAARGASNAGVVAAYATVGPVVRVVSDGVRCGGHDMGMRVHAGASPSSMLWSEHEDRSLKAPERGLLNAIAAGELDEHLVAIAYAVQARRELLHTVSSTTAIAQLSVGDAVMFNRRIRPRYLEHELAVVTELDPRWVTVKLARPVGRFRDGELRCPPLALRKLDRPSGLAAD